MTPSLGWQIGIALLTGAFTVGVVISGVRDLKESFGELRDEVKAQGNRIGKLEVRVAILELPLRKLLSQQHES